MKRVIRLTESDLARIVKRVIMEQNTTPTDVFKSLKKMVDNGEILEPSEGSPMHFEYSVNNNTLGVEGKLIKLPEILNGVDIQDISLYPDRVEFTIKKLGKIENVTFK